MVLYRCTIEDLSLSFDIEINVIQRYQDLKLISPIIISKTFSSLVLLNTGEVFSTNSISWAPLVIACFAHLNHGQNLRGRATVLVRHYLLVDGF